MMLRDGTVTTDWKRLIQEWTVQQPGHTCQPVPEEQCPVSESSRCQVLLSALFAECHKVLAPATFHAICQQDSCHQERVCEVIASYAHLCRTNGVCVDWRTPDFCGESPYAFPQPWKQIKYGIAHTLWSSDSHFPNEDQCFLLGFQLGSNKTVGIEAL